MDTNLSDLAEELERPGDPGWLHRLRVLRALKAALDDWETALLMAARAGLDGASWTEIGEELGMTRQSAWQRFAGEVDRPSTPAHRLLKARIDGLIAETDVELAEAETSDLDDESLEAIRHDNQQALNKQFSQLVDQHARECELAPWKDLL